MQQLKLGISADANSFLRELFVQRLPSNVRMVLASADSSMDLDKLDMADKVMELTLGPRKSSNSGKRLHD